MYTNVKITAYVTAEIEHEVGEDLTKRDLDIYLHGPQGHSESSMEKEDLGIDGGQIEIIETRDDARLLYDVSSSKEITPQIRQEIVDFITSKGLTIMSNHMEG
jgi:hypothetical protein